MEACLCCADEIFPEKKAFIVISHKFIAEGVRGIANFLYLQRPQRSVRFSYSSICSTVNSRVFKESVVTLHYSTIPNWRIIKKNIERDEEELV